MMRLLFGLGLIGAMCGAALADTVIVDETFESYADNTALGQEWFFGSPTNVRLVDQTGLPNAFPVAGKGVQHDGGTVMDWLGFDDPVEQPPLVPSETQSVFVRGDVFDDGLGNTANKRMSIGLRGITPGASNLLELGFYNSDSCDPTVCGPGQIGDPPSSAPQNALPATPGFYLGTTYGYRMQLFDGIADPLLVQPDWQYFQLPLELDRSPAGPTGDYNNNDVVDAADYTRWRDQLGQNVALPNEAPATTTGMVTPEDYTAWKNAFSNVGVPPNGIINSFDVGPGWHRYQATITPDSITVEIDLFRDGLRNTSTTPDGITGIRPGTAGVDASVTWPVTSNTAGYDSFRFGGPSNLSSAGGGLIYDNLFLALVDVPLVGGGGLDGSNVPEPATLVVALLAGALAIGIRRRR